MSDQKQQVPNPQQERSSHVNQGQQTPHQERPSHMNQGDQSFRPDQQQKKEPASAPRDAGNQDKSRKAS